MGGRVSHQRREYSGGDAAGGDAGSKGRRWGGVVQGGVVRARIVLRLVMWVLLRSGAPSKSAR